jgi:hypothetical protein
LDRPDFLIFKDDATMPRACPVADRFTQMKPRPARRHEFNRPVPETNAFNRPNLFFDKQLRDDPSAHRERTKGRTIGRTPLREGSW